MPTALVTRANQVAITVLIGLVALIGLLSWDLADATNRARQWTLHSYTVLATIRELDAAQHGAEAHQRAYLLTGQADELTAYNNAAGHASVLMGQLQRLTADNRSQQDRLRQLITLWQQRTQQLAESIQIRRDRGLEAVTSSVATGTNRQTAAAIEDTLGAVTGEEQRLLEERLNTLDSRADWAGALVLIGVVTALLGLIVAHRLIRLAWQRSDAAEQRQRQLAGRLQSSLDSLSQGVGVFGPSLLLRHWNDCFGVLLNAPSELLREGTPYADFVTRTACAGKPVLETEQQISAGRTDTAVIYEYQTPDERVLEVRRTATPDGGFILTLSDLTKRAEAEILLREAQKMQAIGQLTGGIAHDFNNLLTVILGNLELALARVKDDSPLAVNLERALWATQRGGTLTSHLLAFARKQPLAPAPVALSATLPELVPLLRRTLGEHIDVCFVDSAGLWPAMTDPAQLESAVLNLALNARDAMPGGGRLTIELANKVLDADYARRHSEVVPGDYVMVAVSDTGHGMTPDVIARAFEPFFTTKTEGRGTGLGLAMVFGFVKQSGGHIKIYSEPNEGTSVKMYLPRAIGGAWSDTRLVSAPAELPQGDATILVVEDETGVREVAVAILRSLGYRVLEAADGDEGLRVFGANTADVDMLLTDVVLPGRIRGRELAERITAARPEVKVLFMSGYTENSIVHHGRLDDGVQLLGKPFKREQLARKVAEVLRARPIQSGTAGNVVELRRPIHT
jgi:signal transduction histidine kinase/FixJ family two-component response regulator